MRGDYHILDCNIEGAIYKIGIICLDFVIFLYIFVGDESIRDTLNYKLNRQNEKSNYCICCGRSVFDGFMWRQQNDNISFQG